MAFALNVLVLTKRSSRQKVCACGNRSVRMEAAPYTPSKSHVGPVPISFGERIATEQRPTRLANPAKKRVRQHLNPLAARWRGRVDVDQSWYSTAFEDVGLPLLVDVGCGKGRFAESLAQKEQHMNVLALEIREPLVDMANARAKARGIPNLHFLACNANVSLKDVLDAAPGNALKMVTLQFCDPWFKKRHAKRRMVDGPLVVVIHDALRNAGVDGRVFMQTDVLPLAVQMRGTLDAHRGLTRAEDVEWSKDGWLTKNPLAVKTEREICVERSDKPVYRAMYQLSGADWDRDGIWDSDLLQRVSEPTSLNVAMHDGAMVDLFADSH